MGENKHIIVFHGGKGGYCSDGSCAAAIVDMYIGREENTKKLFVSAAYGEGFDPKLVDKDTTLWIVDFSFPLMLMHQLDERAKEIYWFDHHRTATKLFEGEEFKNVVKIFDENRSGAGIAWDWCFKGYPRPIIVNLVEDRDLWRFRYPQTKPVTEALMYLPKNPEAVHWGQLLHNHAAIEESLIAQGQILLKAKEVRIERAMRRGYYGTIMGRKAFYVNSCEDISEIGERIYLSHTEPIVGVVYHYDGPDIVRFSLRSNTVDVAAIAETFGGGGHVAAAGFSIIDKRKHFRNMLKDKPEL